MQVVENVHKHMLDDSGKKGYNSHKRVKEGYAMPLSSKKAATNATHIAKLDVIRIQPYREEGQKIRAAAAAAGQSLQGYILQAVRDRMEKES